MPHCSPRTFSSIAVRDVNAFPGKQEMCYIPACGSLHASPAKNPYASIKLNIVEQGRERRVRDAGCRIVHRESCFLDLGVIMKCKICGQKVELRFG